MTKVKAAEIRTSFLKFFEKNGHTVVESSSLVPLNDPSLLFTNAGMNQFKDVFTGKDKRSYTRATTSQKVVRAGGKHNDLENVGFTARHHTFFEMLGNFSFGDYFKKDAIRFAWQFITEELKLPKELLYVTVFEKDDEAAEIWEKQEGVPKDRIYRFGEKDNFWAMGDTGPCGPSSEIFIDRGAQYSCGKPTCGMGCDCDRFMEFWNLVFMQFNRDSSGTMTPLPRPSVDTGAGLERLAMILQKVDTNYDTDIFQHIIAETARLAGKAYDRNAESAFPFRVIADHSRATAFLIGDGVLPSNEGRGYVLRRIMRRAIRYGKKLDFTGPFLHKTVGAVIEQMSQAYPDLVEKRTFIEKAVLAEEEQFFRTLERGLALLDEQTAILAQKKSKQLPGDIAFKLYDTFGFPLDLTRIICDEKGITVDEAGFERSMDKQREDSRKNWKGSGEEVLSEIYFKIANELQAAGKVPKFVGYERETATGQCLAILKGSQNVDFFVTPPISETADSAEKSPIIEAVFSETPFYGESGGQMGDRGRVSSEDGTFEAEVIDVQRPVPDLIVAHLRPVKGNIQLGKNYRQETNREIRALTARNHTATHLLHWALREVLGKHVKQAGSLVASDLLRFDFTHFQALTDKELKSIEDMINERVWNAEAVSKKEMKKDEAIAAGAIAFFGEKYGDRVRVVKVGDFSTELCGGTHVDNSSEIHLFKIGNESGIAAGVRRIIAYTSKGAFQYLRERDEEVKAIRDRLKASSTDEIMGRIERMAQSERDLKKQIEQLQAKNASGEVDELLTKAHQINGTAVITHLAAPDAAGVKKLRDLAEMFKQKAPSAVVILGMKDPEAEKASLIISVGPQVPKSLSAADLLKVLAPMIDGKGGGKPDLAQAGGTKPSALPEVLKQAVEIISQRLKA
jgi:alanyl-tRNA synthetase